MGFEPYTIEQLVSYYRQNINSLEGFDISNIYLVEDLQVIADKYGIKESTTNMEGFAVPINGGVVAILNNLNGFNSIKALFHELTHISDDIWFAKAYGVVEVAKHPYYYALQIYSEINAFKIGNQYAVEFLSDGNPMLKYNMYESISLDSILRDLLCKKEIELYDIAKALGYILLYDDFYKIDDHLSHIPDSVSLRLRGVIQSILDAYYNDDIEEMDYIINLITVKR